TVRHTPVDRQHTQLHDPAALGPGPRSVVRRIVRRRKLRLKVKGYRAPLQTLRQLVQQEVWRPRRRTGCVQMDDPLRYHLITDRLLLTRLVDEYERVDPMVLLIGEAVGRGRGGQGGGDGRMAGRELVEFCWLGGIRRARGHCR